MFKIEKVWYMLGLYVGVGTWQLKNVVGNNKRAITGKIYHSHTLIFSNAFILGNSQGLHIPLFLLLYFYRLLHSIVTVCMFIVILKLCGKL